LSDDSLQLEREKLRPLQRNAYLKIAECYSSKSGSAEEVDRCANRYNNVLAQAQNVVNSQLQEFQTRLQRCANPCSDDFQVAVSSTANNHPSEATQRALVKCISQCADRSVTSIGQLQSKLENDIDTISKF
jgi:GTP cyclohydrolase III